MELLLAAIVGAFSSIGIAIVGVYGARKAGLGVTQEKLVGNLKDLVDTLEIKANALEKQSKEQDRQILVLQTQVQDLKDLTISQAELIKQLLSKRKIVIQTNGLDDSPAVSR